MTCSTDFFDKAKSKLLRRSESHWVRTTAISISTTFEIESVVIIKLNKAFNFLCYFEMMFLFNIAVAIESVDDKICKVMKTSKSAYFWHFASSFTPIMGS